MNLNGESKIYSGPLAHLRDKTALIRPGYAPDQVLAQFDDHTATRSGKPFAEVTRTTVLDYEPHARFPTERRALANTPPADCLGYGWHLFPADHFKERQ